MKETVCIGNAVFPRPAELVVLVDFIFVQSDDGDEAIGTNQDVMKFLGERFHSISQEICNAWRDFHFRFDWVVTNEDMRFLVDFVVKIFMARDTRDEGSLDACVGGDHSFPSLGGGGVDY